MTQETLLIVGCGDIGIRLQRQLDPAAYQTVGLRRHVSVLPESIIPLPGDLRDTATAIAITALAPAVVVVSLTPDNYTQADYKRTYVEGAATLVTQLAKAKQQPRLLVWVSSTSVYGQCEGEWVDEKTVTQPESATAKELLHAEQIIQSAPFPTVIVRFSGIYGPGRERLLGQVRAGIGSPVRPIQFTNRIHAEDCAGVLAHLIERQAQDNSLESVYLATDCEPVPLHEVKDGLAKLLGLPDQWQTQEPQRRSIGSKRCANRLLLESGYVFRYPTWREGYQQIITTGAID